MRIVSALVLTALLTMSAQAQLITREDFNFTGNLTANGWTAHSGSGTNPIATTTGLTYTGYLGSSVGNAALVGNAGGEDDNLPLRDSVYNDGSVVYLSFLLDVTDAAASKTGDYFIHLGNRASATTFTAFAARFFAKFTASGVNFGLSNTSTATYGTTNFSKNTTYLIVIKYKINVSGNDTTSFWVFSSGIPATEAAAGAPEVLNSTTAGVNSLNAIGLRQGSSSTSPQVVVDGIRITKTWQSINNVVPDITPKAISFGNVNVSTSAKDTITVSNYDVSAVNISSVTSGDPVFVVTPTTGTLSPNTSQDFVVTYTPSAAGSNSSAIRFTSDAVSSPDSVTVSGAGIQAGFVASTKNIALGNVIINQSKDDSLYVKNTGAISLNISSVASDNSIFTVTPTTAAIGANDSSWFHIGFGPTSVGTKSANIVFTSDAPTSPDTVKVSGVCINTPPPSISSITRSDRVPNAGDSVVVSAKVTDMFGLTGVRLIYYVNDVADSVTMTTPDSIYTGKIPGSVNQNGKRVEYRIHAISTSGMDTLTAKIGYFAGISRISLSGLKGEDVNLLNLYKGYYVKVTGVINGPNYQASNLSQYIQDSFGGLNLYKSGASANAFNLGDSLVVLGKLDQYRGTTEITPDTVTKDIQVIASGKKVTPIDLTIAQFNANPELYESRLVRFNEVYKKYETPVWATNTSLVMYEGTQADTVIMYVNSGVDAGAASEPVYPIKITAIAVQFTNAGTATTGPYEIQPRYQTDFETVPAAPTIVTPVDKATGVPRRTTFTWNRTVNATKYHLQVSTSNTFATTVLDTTLADTTAKPSTPLAASRTYYWHVSALDTVNSSNYSAFASFQTGTGIDAVDSHEEIPKVFALYQNYPNPFNPSTVIRYDLPKNAYVKVVIYDILGRVVANLVDGVEGASQHSVEWNPGNLSSGIYFCRIQARSQDGTSDFASVKKLLFMK